MRIPLVVVALVAAAVVAVAGEANDAGSFRIIGQEVLRQRLDAALARRPADGSMAFEERTATWLYDVGIAADRLRMYALGEAAARQVVTRWPFDGQAWGNLACEALKRGRADEALTLLDEAAKRPSSDALQLGFIRAWSLLVLGRTADARAALAAIPKTEPGPRLPFAQMLRAGFAALAGDSPDAVADELRAVMGADGAEACRRFLAHDPAFDRWRHDPAFVAIVGETAIGERGGPAFPAPPLADDEQALVATLPKLAADPRRAVVDAVAALIERRAWPEALAAIADARAQGGQLMELDVLESLTRIALDDYPASMAPLHRLDDDAIQAWSPGHDAAMCARAATIVDKAVQAAAGTDWHGAGRSVALASTVSWWLYRSARYAPHALRALQIAERWAPRLPEPMLLEALYHHLACDEVAAEVDLRRAIGVDPASADGYAALSSLARSSGRIAMARDWLDRAPPGTPSQRCALARLMLLGEADAWPDAEATLDAFIAQHATAPIALDVAWQLSTTATSRRRFDIAERLTRRCLALDPGRSVGWTKLSGDLMRQGRFADALAAADRALIEGPEDAVDAQLARVGALYGLQRRDEAAAALARIGEPLDDERHLLWQAGRALVAAIAGDEPGVEALMRAMLGTDRGAVRRHWFATDALFDPYRARPWFVAALVPAP